MRYEHIRTIVGNLHSFSLGVEIETHSFVVSFSLCRLLHSEGHIWGKEMKCSFKEA
uniref:Uncharacterized protein n=1 Tax=Anguilla anguilla TaxID=7936 RepID=A0A0E9U821_ANGAN